VRAVEHCCAVLCCAALRCAAAAAMSTDVRKIPERRIESTAGARLSRIPYGIAASSVRKARVRAMAIGFQGSHHYCDPELQSSTIRKQGLI